MTADTGTQVRAVLAVRNEALVAVESVNLLDPGPADVVVRLTASGVCHSDLAAARGTLGPRDDAVQVLGHEGTGVVEFAGDNVHGVAAGDRVVASFKPACGQCWYCVRDLSQHCELRVAGVARVRRHDGTAVSCFSGLGTFSEAMTVNGAAVVRIDSDLPDAEVALIGCAVSTGVGAVINTAGVVPGSTVAVLGCGGVGQAVIQGARIAGAARIIGVDPVGLKRATSLQLGATDAVDPTADDLVEAVRSLTGGRGADYSFEVVGSSDLIEAAWAMTRRAGTIVIIGATPADVRVSFPAYDLMSSERRVCGCTYGSSRVRRDFPRLVALAEAGRLDLTSMVTRTIALDDVRSAFGALESGEVIRSVVLF